MSGNLYNMGRKITDKEVKEARELASSCSSWVELIAESGISRPALQARGIEPGYRPKPAVNPDMQAVQHIDIDKEAGFNIPPPRLPVDDGDGTSSNISEGASGNVPSRDKRELLSGKDMRGVDTIEMRRAEVVDLARMSPLYCDSPGVLRQRTHDLICKANGTQLEEMLKGLRLQIVEEAAKQSEFDARPAWQQKPATDKQLDQLVRLAKRCACDASDGTGFPTPPGWLRKAIAEDLGICVGEASELIGNQQCPFCLG